MLTPTLYDPSPLRVLVSPVMRVFESMNASSGSPLPSSAAALCGSPRLSAPMYDRTVDDAMSSAGAACTGVTTGRGTMVRTGAGVAVRTAGLGLGDGVRIVVGAVVAGACVGRCVGEVVARALGVADGAAATLRTGLCVVTAATGACVRAGAA